MVKTTSIENRKRPNALISKNRKKPNVLITGTPGVGKTTVATSIAERLHFKHLNVGELIKEHECYEGIDDVLDTNILDEDKLLDLMEPMMILSNTRTSQQPEEDSKINNNNNKNEEVLEEEENYVKQSKISSSQSIHSSSARKKKSPKAIQHQQSSYVGIVVDFHICEIFPKRWFDLVLVLRTNTEILYDRLLDRGYTTRKHEENMESEIMQIILEEARDSYNIEIVHEVYSNTMTDIDDIIHRVEQWRRQWMIDHNSDDDSDDDDEEESDDDDDNEEESDDEDDNDE